MSEASGLTNEMTQDQIIRHLQVELDLARSANAYICEMAAAHALREDRLREALTGLLADITEYQTINNLGGENNHWQVAARKALASEYRSPAPTTESD